MGCSRGGVCERVQQWRRQSEEEDKRGGGYNRVWDILKRIK